MSQNAFVRAREIRDVEERVTRVYVGEAQSAPTSYYNRIAPPSQSPAYRSDGCCQLTPVLLAFLAGMFLLTVTGVAVWAVNNADGLPPFRIAAADTSDIPGRPVKVCKKAIVVGFVNDRPIYKWICDD
jgi:hypothetical protein